MTTFAPRTFAARALALATLVAVASPLQAQQSTPAPQAAGPVLQLSMAQAEALALESNLGLKADRLDPVIAQEDLASARSAFNPNVFSTLSRNTSQTAPTNLFESSNAIVTRGGMNMNLGVNQVLPWYGTSYRVSVSGNRSTTTQFAPSFNPQLGSSLSVNISQPLLRNLRLDSGRVQLDLARRNLRTADIQLEQQIVTLRQSVQNSYLSLLGALAGLDVARQTLRLAEDTLKNDRAKVEVGTVAPLVIIQDEAEVASTEESVIRAEASVTTAEDALRALLFDPARPDYWTVKLEPTETMQFQPRDVDVEAATRNALANRTDLLVARRQLENTDLNLKLTKNLTLPDATMNLSYSASGTGGTQFQYSNTFPPVLQNTVDKGFGSVIGDAFTYTQPAWTLSVNMSYPIGKSSVEASLARGRVQRRQQELQIQELERQIVTGVRQIGRDVTTNLKRVQVTQKALEAAKRQLEAEQKRISVGLSTTFELQARQRDLARALVSELNAKIDYNRSLFTFENIQKAPVR